MKNLPDHSPPDSASNAMRHTPEPGAGWKSALQDWVRCRLLRSYGSRPVPPAAHKSRAMKGGVTINGQVAETANRESLIRNLINDSIQGLHIHQKFKPVFVNQACADMFGYDSPEEILTLKSTQELLAPHERARTETYGKNRIRGRSAPTRYEVQGLRKDGSIFWIEQRCDVIDWDGKPAIKVVQIDITEQKEAEQARLASERRFRDLVEGSVQGICIHKYFKPIFANQAYADIFGFESLDEVYALGSVNELVMPEDQDRLRGYALARLRGEDAPSRYTFQAMRKDGSRIWIEQMARVIDWDGEPAIQQTLVDVTEQKESEEALKASERRLRDLIAGSIQGIAILRGFDVIFANQACADIYGYEDVEEVRRAGSIEALLAPEEIPRMRSYAEARQRGEQAPEKYEFKGIRKDGSEIWLLQRARPIEWEGEPAVQVTVIDITEQKRALEELQAAHDTLESKVAERTRELADEVLERSAIEQALRVSEERYRNLFQSMQDGVFLIKDGRLVLANEALCDIHGYSFEDMIDRDFNDFVAPEHRDRVSDIHRRRMRGEEVSNRYEVDLLHADGETRVPVLLNLKAITLPSGDQAVLGTVRDITERKRAERALRESEERFRAIIDNSPSSISLKDTEGRYLLINSEFERCHGISHEDIIGKTIDDKFEKSAAQAAGSRDSEVIKSGKPISFEVIIPKADGRAQTRFVTKFPIRGADGEVTRIATVGTDISDLKIAEKALRENEERFRAFAESSSDWLWELNVESRFTYFSNRIFDVLGFPAVDLVGKTADEIAAQLKIGDGWRVVQAYIDRREPIRGLEYELSGANGARRVVRTSGTPRFSDTGEYLGYLGTTTDITDEIVAREKQEQVHQRFLAAVETVPVGLALFDADDRLVVANERYRDLLPYADIEAGAAFEDLLLAEVSAGAVADAIGQEETWIRDRLKRHRQPSGVLEVARKNGVYQIREHRTVDGFTLVVAHDISDRKAAEQALLNARDELELRVQERTRALEQEIFERKYAQSELQKANEMLEVRVEERTRNLRKEIAERKRFEEQFLQAQKMEAVGQLAGGIAHDFNNLLTVVIANLGWLKDFLSNDQKALRIADLALEGARRAGDLTQRMLAFSRRQELHPRTVEFVQTFGQIEPLITRALRESIDFRIDVEDGLWPLMVDPHQLESSLLNIAINARDAMPDGGTLTLQARNRTLEAASIGPDAEEAGDYVELSLTDTGTGMPREVLDRVMDPFFTTKEVGQGTGLGLSMVFGFAKQSGGFLEIDSEVGKGTTVKLLLPRAPESTEANQPGTPQSAPVIMDDIKVLVVEDDEMVRNVTVEYLKMSGIEGLEADCGDAALETLEANGPVDLVISDVIMPGVNGIDLTQRITEKWPETKVVLMTGYSYEEFSRRGIDPSSLLLLHKPFSKNELLSKIQEAMLNER